MYLQRFRIDVDNAGHMIDLLRVRFDIVRKSTQSYYRYFSEITSAATLNTVIWPLWYGINHSPSISIVIIIILNQ